MNENLNKPEELGNTPPADEAHDIVAQAEAEAPAEATAAPSTDSAKPKSKRPFVALLAILLLAIIGVCAYFLFFQSKPANNQNTGDNQTSGQTEGKTEDGTSSDTDSEASETAIEDQAAISALFEKLLILHHPGLKNYLSYAGDTYAENQYFSFSDRYAVTEKLYTDNLTNSDKLYIATQYMLDQEQLKPASDYGVPSNFYALKNADYCSKNAIDVVCGANDWMKAASEDEVAVAYANIFGEKPASFENSASVCGTLAYDSEYHIYYTDMAGCGGYDGPPHQIYIEKYSKDGTSAYVYLRVATIFEHTTNLPVYKDFFKESELDSAPETAIYSRLEVTNASLPKVITAENYTQFQQYRFVFGKDGDNYYFKTVEKL